MIKTNCKMCSFSKYHGDNQASCVFGRIEKFGEDATKQIDENGGSHYIIDRLCTYYRDKSWGYTENDLETVQKESALAFDIIFDCNNINIDQQIIITSFINNQKYYPSKTNVIILHEYDTYSTVREYVSDIAKNSKIKINISICENTSNHMHQLAMKSKNGYHIYIKHPEIFENDSLCRMNHYVNEELKKFLVCNLSESYVVSNATYRLFSSINNSFDYFKNINEIIEHCRHNNMYIEL